MLDNLNLLMLKFENQAKCSEKIEMGLYYPTSRYRDCFLLHFGMNLSLVVDAKTIVLSFRLSFDIGLAWSVRSWLDGIDNLSHTHVLAHTCEMLQTLIKLMKITSLEFVFDMMYECCLG